MNWRVTAIVVLTIVVSIAAVALIFRHGSQSTCQTPQGTVNCVTGH